MKPRASLLFPRTAEPDPKERLSDSEAKISVRSAHCLRKGVSLVLAALLVPATGGELLAQAQQQYVPPPPPPDSAQTAPAPQQQYNGQNPVVPDPNYVPPASQQQPYEQQQYAPEQAPPPPDANQAYAQSYPDESYGQGAPVATQALSPDQLDQLVAPIALYPDSLLANVLAASTYPAQVVDADRWRQAQGNAAPEQIAAGADAQNWDPSIKSLSAFPQVLDQMAQNVSWTTELGNAYYNQPQDVMSAVQAMRQRAQGAGTLQNTPQLAVSDDQGYIALAPSNPQVIYVPEYDPWTVYGAPVAPYPGFSCLDTVGSLLEDGLEFGVGIALGAFMHMPWGFLGWGFNWLDGSLLFHGGGWYTHSREVRDWGFAHGGPRAVGWRGGVYHGRYGDYRERAFGGREGEFGGRAGAFGGRPGASFGNRGGYLGGRSFREYGAGPARLNAERAQGFRGGYGNGFHGNNYGRGQLGFNGTARNYGSGAYGRGSYGRAQGFMGSNGRAVSPFSGNHSQPYVGSQRGSYGNSYGRSPMIARNYGGEGFGRGPEMNGYRQAPQMNRGFGQSYRAPSQSFRGFNQPSRGSAFGRGFSGRSSGGFAAPRSFGGPHSFGGGHAFTGGGGHSFGGGGHSFGGGSHFGGGHSFGGGHGGHSGGGGHGGGGHGGGGGHHR